MGQTPKTLLKVLVDQRRWRYADFETAFTATADSVIGKGTRNPTVGESQFRRWTGGKLKGLPSPDTCRVLEAIFGVEAVALLAPPPATANPEVAAFNLEDEITMTAHEAHDDAGATAAASISDTTLDQIRDDVTALARQYNELPAFDVWRKARSLREQVEVQRERTQIPSQQQELLILAGQSAALLAAAAFDLGSLDGAKRLARTASLYGESARFNPLRAYADGSLAYIAYFSGEPSRAVSLARRAWSYGGLGDVAMRRLRAIEARAHGHLGDAASARASIRLSEEDGPGYHDNLHDVVGGEFGFAPERLAMSNSSTALLIGDGPQAEAAARRALKLIASKANRNQSAPVLGGAAADLAMARLMSNDVEGAAEAMRTVWNIPGDQRVTGLLTRTAKVRGFLSQPRFHGSPVPTEIRERIEDFTRAATSHQLGGQSALLALEA